MICTYVSRGDQYNNFDVTSARNIFQSSGHSKMVSNTSQTYPKYLISIGIIIWNEKKEFRTLSQGDHNHWCVGKENNRPKSTLCFQHWCSTCYIKDIFLICCYFIRHRHQKSSHQARQLHQPKQSDIPKRKTLSEKTFVILKRHEEGLIARKSHISIVSPTQSAISLLVWQSSIENISVSDF